MAALPKIVLCGGPADGRVLLAPPEPHLTVVVNGHCYWPTGNRDLAGAVIYEYAGPDREICETVPEQ